MDTHLKPTAALARLIATTTFSDIPSDVVRAAKTAVLDGVAVMVAGTVQQPARLVREYVEALGGQPVATVIGGGFKTNTPNAAFANGVSGHVLDYEIQGFPPTHGTSSCLPAALALAEQLKAPGARVITAYVLGWEIQGRLRAASAHATNPAFHPPGLVGPLGGAAASANILGLDTDHAHTALAIAATRTGGLTANTGTMVKSTHPGNAARMGVEAALLSDVGFNATQDILEVPTGYAAALFDGDINWDIVLADLGSTWRLVDPGFRIKRFPAQIHMQNPTEAVLNLRAKHNISPETVERLQIKTDSEGHSGSLPRSGLDGKFSIEYCAAAALLDGEVTISTFTDKRRFSPDMEAVLPRIVVERMDAPGDVTLAVAHLANGTIVQEQCRSYTGSTIRPMATDMHLEKVRDCLSQSLSHEQTEALITQLMSLEDVEDITTMLRLIN